MTDYVSRKIKIISFIAILFVLFQHAINFTGYIEPSSTFVTQRSFHAVFQYVVGYGFARIAVALFFLLSGFLFFRNFTIQMYLSKVRSRVTSLLIPYVVWSTLGLVLVYLLQTIPVGTDYFSVLFTGRVVGQPFLYYVQSILNHGVSFQLWFLVDLMLYTLLAPLFYIVLKSSSVLFLIPITVLWLLQIPLPPIFSFLYRGGLFYLIGAYIALFSVYIPKEKTKHLALLSLISWMTILVIKTCIAFGVFPSQWLSLVQIDNMAIVMGIATVWFGYDVVSQSSLMKLLFLGTPFTFFIYVAHEPLLEIIKRIGVDVLGRSDASFAVLYVGTIGMTLLLTLGCGYVLRIYAPSLYRFLVGGRV